jgi:hypothetical protein
MPGFFFFGSASIIRAFGRPELVMVPEVDLSIPPADAKAANGYAELYALWKADEEAYNQGRRKSDAEFIVWMATVRLYLSEDETLLFDLSSSGTSIDEFRAEKAATLAKILWDRRGFKGVGNN